MNQKWLQRLAQTVRRERWRWLVVLVAYYTLLALGAGSAVKGLDFGLLWLPLILGLALAWSLAASPLSSRLTALLVILIGPPLLLLQFGDLDQRLMALVRSLFKFVNEAIVKGAIPSSAKLQNDWEALSSGVLALITQLFDWFLALARSQMGQSELIFNPVATAFLWLSLFFGTAVWAAWAVRRRKQPLLGSLPGLLLLAAMVAAGEGSTFFLATALVLVLVLKAALAHTRQEEYWDAQAITYSPRFGATSTWSAAGLAFVLSLAALITPSLSVYRLVEAAKSLAVLGDQQELARSLGLNAASGAADDLFTAERNGGLPARHLIGSGPELSQEEIMAITIEHPVDLAEELRYWRGATYDRYDGRGWLTRGTANISYDAGQPAGGLSRESERELLSQQQLVRQFVRPLAQESSLLYAAGKVVTADQPFQAAWRARYENTDDYFDLFAASLLGGDAKPYRLDARVPIFTKEDLRAAGPEFPDWIASNYLTLPEGISGRVLALARELTAVEPTSYDRARAIESHLRQFPYTLDLPAPPAGREIADYFLFEIQRGYCDYYATAMVVLARAAGLPSRLATGYIGNRFDEVNGQSIITADLAHSWPEIYFPELGWISFEPTAGRLAIERPTRTLSTSLSGTEEGLEPITAGLNGVKWGWVILIIATSFMALVVGVLAWWSLESWRLRRLAPSRTPVRLYAQLARGAARMGLAHRSGETPHEFAGRLGWGLMALSRKGRGTAMLASAPTAIEALVKLYTQAQYSPHKPGTVELGEAIQSWSRLRFQLLLAWLLHRWSKSAGAVRLRYSRR